MQFEIYTSNGGVPTLMGESRHIHGVMESNLKPSTETQAAPIAELRDASKHYGLSSRPKG
jgi:hypothetical protein